MRYFFIAFFLISPLLSFGEWTLGGDTAEQVYYFSDDSFSDFVWQASPSGPFSAGWNYIVNGTSVPFTGQDAVNAAYVYDSSPFPAAANFQTEGLNFSPFVSPVKGGVISDAPWIATDGGYGTIWVLPVQAPDSIYQNGYGVGDGNHPYTILAETSNQQILLGSSSDGRSIDGSIIASGQQALNAAFLLSTNNLFNALQESQPQQGVLQQLADDFGASATNGYLVAVRASSQGGGGSTNFFPAISSDKFSPIVSSNSIIGDGQSIIQTGLSGCTYVLISLIVLSVGGFLIAKLRGGKGGK